MLHSAENPAFTPLEACKIPAESSSLTKSTYSSAFPGYFLYKMPDSFHVFADSSLPTDTIHGPTSDQGALLPDKSGKSWIIDIKVIVEVL
jgi:hypothetical protein